MNRIIILACLLAIFNAAFAQNEAAMLRNQKLIKELNGTDSVIYKTVNGEILMLTLYLPKVKKFDKTPVMLFTHGGGWAKGDRYNILLKVFAGTLKTLLGNGVACASVEYRLTRIDTSNAFDCVVDCKDAGRYLVKNAARYGFDIQHIGVWGGSAGGHLSLMTALGKSKDFPGDPELSGFDPNYKCVAAYFPLASFVVPDVLIGSNFENPKRFPPMLGGMLSDKMELAKLLSPAEYISNKTLPILLLHGDNDKVLNIKNSLYLMEVGKHKDAPIEMLTVKNAGHSFQGTDIHPSIDEVNQYSAKFILSHL